MASQVNIDTTVRTQRVLAISFKIYILGISMPLSNPIWYISLKFNTISSMLLMAWAVYLFIIARNDILTSVLSNYIFFSAAVPIIPISEKYIMPFTISFLISSGAFFISTEKMLMISETLFLPSQLINKLYEDIPYITGKCDNTGSLLQNLTDHTFNIVGVL